MIAISRSIALATFLASFSLGLNAETLPPLKDGASPETLDEVWGDYDPRAEPLDVEVHKEWVEEGTVLRAVRFRIGIFKGQKSWMAGFYAFPEGGKDLPALVQIHGGGGAASKQACIANAKRGYATFSVNWRADERYLKGENLPAAAQTDWGAVEGRQVAESRGIEPNNNKRFDPVPSARNSGYFLRTLAMRRALTFLEQQPEVDGGKLGVDGHSMGGVITLQTAAMDERVKAAAPSCAPPLVLNDSLIARTASPGAYAEKIKVPILFMAPSNDFHGQAEDVKWIIDHAKSDHIRIARSMHLNHKHDKPSLASKELWFDSLLKGDFKYPKRPEIKIDLKNEGGKPLIQVTADDSRPIAFVDVYYTRDARFNEYANNRTRLWQYVKPLQDGNRCEAKLDLFNLDEPLWVIANVHYALENGGRDQVLRQSSDTFTVSSRMVTAGAEDLQKAGLKTHGETTKVIESFGENWKKEWVFERNGVETWLLNDGRVPIPELAKLVIELSSEHKTDLKVKVGATHAGNFPLQGGEVKQTIEVYPFDLKDKDTGARLLNWLDLARPVLSLGSNRGVPSLKKVSWEPVTKEAFLAKRPFQVGDAVAEDGKAALTFQLADKVSGRIDTESKTVKSDFAQGMQVHSPSELTYFLKGEFKTFHATLVNGHQASVSYEVHADGKKLFESDLMRGTSEPRDIDVDISGAQELRLVVTEGGNGWGGDWVMWAEPYCK